MLTSCTDDVPQLSADTLAALLEFYDEAKQQELVSVKMGNPMPQENWQLSQFWYDRDTANKLAREAIKAAGDDGRIACISTPTAFKYILEQKPNNIEAKLLEFDKRFKAFDTHFVFYDYREPVKLPSGWKSSFDIVLADPPFLTEECLSKMAMTVHFLTKGKIILCTGNVMADLAERFLQVRPCKFQPKHHNNLQNEFSCYTNFEPCILNTL